MKSRSIVLLAALLAITFSTAGAASKNRKTIELTESIAVGNVILEPGSCTIEWNGAGPQVQVTFSQRKAIMATVPATLEVAKNPFSDYPGWDAFADRN